MNKRIIIRKTLSGRMTPEKVEKAIDVIDKQITPSRKEDIKRLIISWRQI